MKKRIVLVVTALTLVALLVGVSAVMAAKPQNSGSGKDVISLSNGFPSGQHFNLNIHGKQAGFSGGEDPGGHSVFTLEYCPPDETTGEPTEHIQYVSNKKAAVTDLQVLDKCTEAFDTTPAKVQLPFRVMTDEGPKEAGGYYVFARILGKPNNGNIEPTSNIILYPNTVVEACNDLGGNEEFPDYTECPGDPLLALGLIVGQNVYGATPEEYVRFDPAATTGKGKSKATDITRLFIYTGWVVDATLDANDDEVIDINDVPVADYDGNPVTPDNQDYNNDLVIDEADVEAWLTDMAALAEPMAWYFANEWIFNIADLVITEQGLMNDGTKLVQLRFYPVVTTTFGSHIIVQKDAPEDTLGTAFGFDPSYGSDFSLRHDESKDSGALEAGTYTVTEILPAGWDLDWIEFDDLDPSTINTVIDGTAEINLAPGETVRVIFHNVPAS